MGKADKRGQAGERGVYKMQRAALASINIQVLKNGESGNRINMKIAGGKFSGSGEFAFFRPSRN